MAEDFKAILDCGKVSFASSWKFYCRRRKIVLLSGSVAGVRANTHQVNALSSANIATTTTTKGSEFEFDV